MAEREHSNAQNRLLSMCDRSPGIAGGDVPRTLGGFVANFAQKVILGQLPLSGGDYAARE
jgi:hypothetical protein